MLTLAFALALSAAPVGLSAAPFVQLPTQGAAAQIQWTWPAPDRFIATLEAPITPPRMAVGKARFQGGDDIGKAILARITAGKDPTAAIDRVLKRTDPLGEGALIWSGQGVVFEPGARSNWLNTRPTEVVLTDARTVLVWPDYVVIVDAPAVPLPDTLSPAPLTNWAYASTLLRTEAPVYDATRGRNRGTNHTYDDAWKALSKSMKADPADALARLAKIDLTTYGDHDHRLGQIATFLAGQGRVDEALALYARFRPIGRCSMDTAPAETARAYADLCYGAGRIGCFLQLQVRIMGDRFNRVAWSSYGERAAQTESTALTDAGIDPRRFLLGLLVQFDDPRHARPREEMNLWRLARSMHESKLDFVPDLERLARDAALDVVNRHRAAQTLWLLQRRARQTDADTVAAQLARLDLPPVTQAWVAAVEAAHQDKPTPSVTFTAQ